MDGYATLLPFAPCSIRNEGVNETMADEKAPEQPKAGSLKVADQEPGPYNADAELNDPPVRTNDPNVPVLETLAVGAGAHTPLDDDNFDTEGRYVGPAPGRPKGVEGTGTKSTEAAKAAK